MIEEYKEEQNLAYKIIIKAIENNNFSHAYLFETNGYKKAPEFLISVAKTLLCPHNYKNKEKCNDCHICERIDKNIYSELKIINPDGMWIKKEQLISLQNEFKTKSVESNKKVYIINNVERLNSSSANSILKFLEEPEDNIFALLATDNIHQLLDTIISRCQIITLNKNDNLENKNVEEKLLTYVNISLDEINDVLTNTLDYIYYLEQHHLETIVYNNNLVLNKFETKEKIESFFEIMVLFYKDTLDYKLTSSNNIFDIRDIEKIAKLNTIDQLQSKINCIIKIKKNLKVNANMNLLLDKLVIDLEGGMNG